jgi:type IV pilus assembly protein PilM
VFGSAFGETAEGPVFGEPTITAPAFEEPAAPASQDPYQPAFEAPTFDAPAFGAPSFDQPAEGPSFDLPDLGPANNGPVIPEPAVAPQVPPAAPETPAFTTPLEPVALTPDEAPLRPSSVPDVVSEAERHRAEISNAFMPVVAELAQELRRSLEYYSTRANNATVHRVLLFGGTANLPGLTTFLESELGVPVQIVGLPNAASLSSSAVSADYIQQVATMLPVAVGLASRDALVAKPPIGPIA